MSGGRQSFRQRGIIPRVLTQLFGEARARAAQQDVSVSVSYLEIYNELLYDLLDITTQVRGGWGSMQARGDITMQARGRHGHARAGWTGPCRLGGSTAVFGVREACIGGGRRHERRAQPPGACKRKRAPSGLPCPGADGAAVAVHVRSALVVCCCCPQPHEISVQDTTSASRGAGAGIKVAGLRTVAVHSEAEAMKLLFEVRPADSAAETQRP